MLGTAGATTAIVDVTQNPNEGCARYEGLKISGFSGACLIDGSGGTGVNSMHVINCELSGGTNAVKVQQDDQVLGCWIHGQTSHGISGPSAYMTGLTIVGNIISGCGGDGVNLTNTRGDMYGAVEISSNTIDGCTGDGVELTSDNVALAGTT